MDAPSCECIKGTIHAGQPVGSEEPLHGLNVYVTGNRTNPRAIIVVYSDIFGLPLPNNRLIADAYAKSGEYLVYLPDFFEGDPVPLKVADTLLPVDASKQSTLAKYTGLLAAAPSFLLWMRRHREAHCQKVCFDFLAQLRRDTPSDRKIGMVGFCWGGKYALQAGRERNQIEVDGGKKVPLVDAVVALHPSHVALPGDVEDLMVPVSVGWGLEDQGVDIAQKGLMEDVHEKEKKNGRQLPEIQHKVYKPGRHGFAVRGNPEDPLERACLEESEKQVLDWFARWL
ncbi:dienelactone hydrolase family protein [Aspergillus saccharolyticus JOP 1030-1]|uniref:Alpha/beta-hydrolase n=1 Tax=Aspergillus saccharolyticus JOP 1030-1 TaxID=1450539 RepID=A0A318Z5S1_9EURO|nr:alpha/beta-hydrolase [Aspergillus saccharolyticus JOP 1030-1]PYH41784.1 alpha/beta-hydrolase [Aspergillus saccharolyticus JOP 1030-1]